LTPDQVIKTDENEYFLNWKSLSFGNSGKINAGVVMKVRTFKYDLNTAKKKPIVDKTDLDTLSYLKDEDNFRCHSKPMIKTAATLSGNSREEIVKQIFDFTMQNLDYKIYFFQDRGAKQALKDGQGDCTEYSELMVTLCRTKKIPARIVKGLIPKIDGTVGRHNWVEVFFPEYGWVAFDPTWADHPRSTTTFYSMKNTYVQLSNKRHINPVICSCKSGDFPFSFQLKDSCNDLSNGISDKFGKMRAFYSRKNHTEALKLIDTLLIHEPDNSSYCLYKGMIHTRLGEYDKGFDYLEQARDYAKSNFEKYHSLYALGNYYALKEEKEEAVKVLKEAFEMGFIELEKMRADSDLQNLKDFPPYLELQKEMKAKIETNSKKD
jgi:hypothetical protein